MNSVKPTIPKKKQSSRTSYNQKHAKSKRESATERQLINKSKDIATKKATSMEDANYVIERRGRKVSVSSISLEHKDDRRYDATSLWSRTGSATSLSFGSPSTKGISFNIYFSKQALMSIQVVHRLQNLMNHNV